MERELWKVLTAAIAAVDADFVDNPRFTHRTAELVRVYLWAVLHERSVNWACQAVNWPAGARERQPGMLPDQSCLSRRTRRVAAAWFERFLSVLARRLSPSPDPRLLDIKRLDGKPLLVAAHSKDPDAAWGRGAGGMAKGYKLHALWGQSILPEAFVITPLNVCERRMARRLVRRLQGAGYVVADGCYDTGDLFALTELAGYQLLAPRARTHGGLGHRRRYRARLRSIQLLENAAFGLGQFGPELFAQRRTIEQQFAHLTTGVGGLAMSLPPSVRRIWRVRTWVHCKLLIFAARRILSTAQTPNAA